jgi:hypothetical protein
LQIVNKPEVVVEYELAKVGLGGVGRVELWLTTSDGQSWEAWMEDGTMTPATSAGANGKYKRTLHFPGEGIYGLKMVVYNRANRGRKPKSGDLPDMRIEIDLTPPHAELYPLEVNPQQRNSLMLSWKAQDRNLAQYPITLEWAAQRGGRWETIAANLPNSGKYNWTPPPNLPPYIFLRLRVRDQAGNEGVAETRDPQLADLSEPEGRLIGVVSSSSGE